jgi:class 3 adenylate cyclase
MSRDPGVPKIRFARTNDGVHIAYQVVGEGPIDVVVIASALGLDRIWRGGRPTMFPAAFVPLGRLILLDRRGTGLSDHILDRDDQLSLDAQMEDVRAVLDAAGSHRAVLVGFESGFAVAAMFAATYPERTVGLIAYAARARQLWASDYPYGMPRAESDAELVRIENEWATTGLAKDWLSSIHPTAAHDPQEVEEFVEWMRSVGGPGDAVRWAAMDRELDLRDILGSIRVPSLILQREGDRETSVEHARYLAGAIPGATMRLLPGEIHQWDRTEDLPVEVGRFVATLRDEQLELDRYLATVLFTDIVGSTRLASDSGDTGWQGLVERHHHVVRGSLARYRGREMDTAGDGFFAAFDGPARAVRSALTIVDSVATLGIEVRAGIHTGEVQTIDGKAGGIAVVIGARISGLAGPSEVLVSQTVKDLTAGSGLTFEDAGEHELKGVPERWRLYRVAT